MINNYCCRALKNICDLCWFFYHYLFIYLTRWWQNKTIIAKVSFIKINLSVHCGFPILFNFSKFITEDNIYSIKTEISLKGKKMYSQTNTNKNMKYNSLNAVFKDKKKNSITGYKEKKTEITFSRTTQKRERRCE